MPESGVPAIPQKIEAIICPAAASTQGGAGVIRKIALQQDKAIAAMNFTVEVKVRMIGSSMHFSLGAGHDNCVCRSG